MASSSGEDEASTDPSIAISLSSCSTFGELPPNGHYKFALATTQKVRLRLLLLDPEISIYLLKMTMHSTVQAQKDFYSLIANGFCQIMQLQMPLPLPLPTLIHSTKQIGH